MSAVSSELLRNRTCKHPRWFSWSEFRSKTAQEPMTKEQERAFPRARTLPLKGFQVKAGARGEHHPHSVAPSDPPPCGSHSATQGGWGATRTVWWQEGQRTAVGGGNGPPFAKGTILRRDLNCSCFKVCPPLGLIAHITVSVTVAPSLTHL